MRRPGVLIVIALGLWVGVGVGASTPLPFLPAPVAAQETPSPGAGEAADSMPDGFCFPVRPLPQCRAGLLLGLNLSSRVAGIDPVESETQDWLVGFDLGVDVNLDERSALGGSVFLTIDSFNTGEEGRRQALAARYRRWFTPDFSGVVSLGPLRAYRVDAEPGPPDPGAGEWVHGMLGEVGLTYRGSVGVHGTLETLQDLQGGTHTAAYVGGHLESWAAGVGTVGGFLVLMLAYTVLVST